MVPPGKVARVSVSGPPGGKLEIEIKPNEVVLYGWVGSTLEVTVTDPEV